ncbi:MAG: PaaI family thioesterase [Bryobacteraceae bacterium]|nr:PaaI family thioesterase [Bryobacteraceae bacterium]
MSLTPEKESELRASFASQGLQRSLGAVLGEMEEGRCVVEVPFSAAVTQQNGFFHGGVVGAVADTAGGYAALTALPAGCDVLTMEYKINFLRPAAGERIIADARVLRAGQSVVVTRVDVHVEQSGQRRHCAALQQSVMRSNRE